MKILRINLSNPPDTRHCSGPDDWGDVLTIGKHLKKREVKFPFKDDDFAIYLGNNTVGIKSIGWDWKIAKKIEYQSIEEMKAIWILD